MTFDDLAKACSATPANALKYAPALTEAMARFEINTQRTKAMFLAQCAVESGYLATIEEGLYYKDAAYLASIFKTAFKRSPELAAPYTRNPKGLSQKVYDGFHGRGLIQLSLYDNYRAFSDYMGIDYVSNPDLLLQPMNAAMSAAWYFTKKRDCMMPAERGDVRATTLLINTAGLHLAERTRQYEIALQVKL